MSRSRRLAAALAPVLALAAPLGAQTGFAPDAAGRQRALEARVVEAIEPAWLADASRVLSARPHVAGSPGQAGVRDTLLAWLGRWGLETGVAEYVVFLPWATRVSVALTAPDTVAFALVEPPIPGDDPTAWPQYPWVNGYSAPGTAEAEAVYVHYGLHEDYERLDSLGVDVSGRVVVARYGGSYRGIKARLAERHGAAALLLYSDPADDGYVLGDVVPDGPFRPWHGVQRGSVMNGVGDPTTPTGPSRPGAPRVALSRSPAELPGIPVVPISYAVAAEVLSRLGGAALPDPTWQGGLPFRYHVGPGPARVRVEVEDDRDGADRGLKRIFDVLGRIEGTEWPDEWVVVGAHADAWGPGANDNVSGTASVLAAARAIAGRAAAGERPRRTIVFAGWDAEEWGLIGSVEWVEEHAAELDRGGVAYLNQDAIGGTRFAASAAPSLEPLVREAAGAVPAGEGRTLLDDWGAGREASGPPLGDLGGGSDYAGFYNHLGVPSVNHGFGAPGGVYHSTYDTWRWMAEHGDPGFVHHALSAELVAVLALRLANAEIHPYDPRATARVLAERWRSLRQRAADVGLASGGPAANALDRAFATLEAAGGRLVAARDAYLRAGPRPERSRRANASLRAAERAFVREKGLVGRPWFRNLAFAADDRSGYSTLALPSIAEAVEAADGVRLRAEILDLAARVEAAARRTDEAAAALGGAPATPGDASRAAPGGALTSGARPRPLTRDARRETGW